MTAKTLKSGGKGIDCTRGLSRGQRAINRGNKRESSLASSCSDGPKLSSDDDLKLSSDDLKRVRALMKKVQKFRKIEKEQADAENRRCANEALVFGILLPDRPVSDTPFEEESFGYSVKPGMHLCKNSENESSLRDVSSIVVSLGLFDGDEMLFACSGIPISCGTTTKLDDTRFVTSACLVREFNRRRNIDDKLRVEVRLPDDTITDGFLGLYDNDIAIVTSLGILDVNPIDLDYKPTPICSDSQVIAAGRAFNSGSLMAMGGFPHTDGNVWAPNGSDTTKAVLGGPLIGNEEGHISRFLGMNIDLTHDMKYTFLPLGLLRERLEHFQILNPKVFHFRNYTLPEGVSTITPSGFMRSINRIKSLGYPMPPPLVLEFNGQLLNQFEDCFGELHAWKGYPNGPPCSNYSGLVWSRLSKKVLTKISRRVVLLASFNGDGTRFFACTGLLIKLYKGTVILTSASLVRKNDDVNTYIHKIEVFLPPNQCRYGVLEMYNLNYNIAIIRVKAFYGTCPEDIFITNLKSSEKVAVGHDTDQGLSVSKENLKPSEEVIAIGRSADKGLLMGTIGKVKPTNEDSKLDCKELMVSTCKISKAGIGGPLINFDGSLVGMNFSDGRSVTPFLPKSKILEVLNQMYCAVGRQRATLSYMHGICDDGWPTKKNKWCVPDTGIMVNLMWIGMIYRSLLEGALMLEYLLELVLAIEQVVSIEVLLLPIYQY